VGFVRIVLGFEFSQYTSKSIGVGGLAIGKTEARIPDKIEIISDLRKGLK
jgi:hypothetical protein